MAKRILGFLAVIGTICVLAAWAQNLRSPQRLAVYDADGKKVSVVAGGTTDVGAYMPVVAFKIGGVPVMLGVARDAFKGFAQVAWESSDCTGTPFLIMNGIGYNYARSSLPSFGVSLPGNTVYVEDGPARNMIVGSESKYPGYGVGSPPWPPYQCTQPPFPWSAVSFPARPLIDMSAEFKPRFTVR